MTLQPIFPIPYIVLPFERLILERINECCQLLHSTFSKTATGIREKLTTTTTRLRVICFVRFPFGVNISLVPSIGSLFLFAFDWNIANNIALT